MYLLRDNPVKAATAAILRAAGAGLVRLGRAAAWMLVFIGFLNIASLRAQCPALPPATVSDASIACSYDAALTRLFTPRAAPDGTYHVFVSSSSLDKIAALLRGQDSHNSSRWAVQEMDPLEAFGSAGEYDQVALARLYVGRRARVARGPVVVDGKVKTSVWLISPYPDARLSRLEPGTLIIEFRVPQ